MSVAPIEPSLVYGGRIVNPGIRETASLILATLTLLISLVNAIGVLLVNGKVDGLTGTVDHLTGTVDHLTDRVDDLTDRVDDLTGRVDHLTDGVDHLTGRVDRLTGRVDALQAVITADIDADARP